LAGQDSHLLDDTQSFMKASHPPVPIDPHCLVALIFLSTSTSIYVKVNLPALRLVAFDTLGGLT